MHTHTLPPSTAPGARPAPGPRPASFLVLMRAALQRWMERQRRLRAYRRDLDVLAAMGERELADFGAPGWLRADVERHRSMARTWS